MAMVRNALVRIGRSWRALERDQRQAAIAAFALLVTMVLPWYDKNVAVGSHFASDHLSAFGVFSWVEAAIFLVSIGVMMLLFYRGEQRAFHLPGGDGTVIFGAGLWAAFLFLWRVFDRPSATGSATTVGIQWGFFFAFLTAGVLAYAGYRLKTSAAAVPGPTRAQDPTTREEPAPPPRREITSTRERRR